MEQIADTFQFTAIILVQFVKYINYKIPMTWQIFFCFSWAQQQLETPKCIYEEKKKCSHRLIFNWSTLTDILMKYVFIVVKAGGGEEWNEQW